MVLIAEIGNTDFGPRGAGIMQQLAPKAAGGAGRIGTGDTLLAVDGGGGYSILPMMPVHFYEQTDTNSVLTCTITNGGTGYSSAPSVAFAGGGGSGVTAHCTVSGGHITNILIDTHGSGFTSAPAVSFSGGGGSGGAATANIGPYLTNIILGGYVCKPDTTRLEGTAWKQWAVAVQDYNLQFRRLVPQVIDGVGTTIPAGTFTAQAQAIVSACNSGADVGIDATSQVAALTGGTILPALGPFYGASLGTMIDALIASAMVVNPALVPVKALGPDPTVGPTRTSFGGPVLYLFDSALLPAPVMSLSDSVPGDILQAGSYTRSLDGVDQVTGRQSVVTNPDVHYPVGGGPYYTGLVSGAIATYPNECDPAGVWWDELLIDDQTSGGVGAEATANLTGVVASIALTSGGGYTSPPSVEIIGDGAGAVAVAILAGGAIISIPIDTAGTGYTGASVMIEGDGFSATATATVSGGHVTGITVTAGGHNYTTATVTITGDGTGATAHAVFAASAIRRIDVTAGGAGYLAEPAVSISGGGGSGAAAFAVQAGGQVTAIHLLSGYNSGSGPTIVFTDTGGGTGAAATATRTASVGTISVTAAGSGYSPSNPATVTIAEGFAGARGAAGEIVIGYGLASFVVDTPGTYATAPTVVITGDGSGAVGTAHIDGSGHLTSITVTTAGSGYTTAPAISFTGGGGAGGGAAHATLLPTGGVKSVTILARGHGFTGTPSVIIHGGAGSGATATATLTHYIDSMTLTARGSGYSVDTVVAFIGIADTASALATITQVVNTVTVTVPGAHYLPPVIIGFTSDQGGGAAATATLSAGHVTAITVTNGGAGYDPLVPPAVIIHGSGDVSAAAQAVIDADVAATAYPRETLVIHTQRTPPPLPGQVVSVTLSTEGLIAEPYLVVSASSGFVATGATTFLITTELTLNLPQLLLGERPARPRRPPVVAAPPAPPSRLDYTTAFQPGTGYSADVWTWDVSPDPHIDGYLLTITPTGGGPAPHFIAGRMSTTWTEYVNAGATGTAQIQSHGLNGLYSVAVPVTPLPWTAAPAFAPDPPVLNPALKYKPQQNGTYTVAIAFTPGGETHGPHSSYLFTAATAGAPNRQLQQGGDQISLNWPNLSGGRAYTFTAHARSAPGDWPGPESGPVSITLPGGGDAGAGTQDIEGGIAGWVVTPDANGDTRIVADPTVVYKAPAGTILFSPDVSTAQAMPSVPLPAVPGQVFGIDSYYLLDSGAAPSSVTVAWLWYDVPAPVYGTDTPFATDTDTLATATTAWQRYTMKHSAPPAGANIVASLIVLITVSLGSTPGTFRLDMPVPPQAAKGTAQLAPSTDLTLYHPDTGAALGGISADLTTGVLAVTNPVIGQYPDLTVHTLHATGDLSVAGTASLSDADIGGNLRVLGNVTAPLPLRSGLIVPRLDITTSSTTLSPDNLYIRLAGGDAALPDASSNPEQVYYIVCVDSHGGNVTPGSSDTIGSGSAGSSLVLAQWDHAILISNGVDGWDQW